MSWSEIKKKKEEEEKKKKSTNTSDSTVKQISNVVTGNLWKNIGQNIITSQRNAEARKQREEEFKRKLNVTQNIPISQKTTTNTKREIKPSVIQSYANNYNSSNKNGNTWEQIKNIVNNRNIMTLANKNETKNATEITSSDIDAMRESNEFNRIMQNGTRKEQIDAVIGHFGNSIIGGAKQTIGGIGNVGTTLGATAVKSARNMARLGKNEKLAERLDSVYNKIVDKGRDINDRATYFNKVNSRIDNNTVRTVTGATNTVANVATNAFLSAGTGGGTVLQGLQVGGSSAQEVLNENKNNIGKATTTGIAKGITSYLTEKMFDANILTKGAEKSSIQKLVNNKIESKIKSQLGRNIADKATGIIGENLEEIVEDNVGNLIDRVVNNKKLPEWKEWLNNTSETIKATTLSTAILNLIGLGGDNNQDIEADLRKQNASEQDIQKAKEFVRAVTQENIQSQNTDNQVINQETKTFQNGFSEAEKTETLRQEARNKLESIKQNYDENSYNQMQEFIETAPSEKALNQVISDLNKEAETKQVAPIKQKQEVQLPMKQETQNKSFEDVAFDAMSNYESNEVESPLKNRDMDSIGKQTKVNAYQYDNPKVKPYFQEMAQQMGEDLAYISSSDNRSTQKGGGTKLSATTKAMDILHNEQGYSYNQIAQGLQNIIDDKGSENNAISKKIELVIDEQLRNGYTNALGKNIEPNQEYINAIQPNNENNTEYIKPYSQNDISYLSKGNNLIDGVNSDLKSFAEKYYDINTKMAKKKIAPVKTQKLFLGRINDKVSSYINSIINNSGRFNKKYDVTDSNIVIGSNNIEHFYNEHGNETNIEQIDVTPENISKYPEVVSSPDYIGLSDNLSRGNTPTVYMAKRINGYSVAVEVITNKKQMYPEAYYIYKSNSSEWDNFIKNHKLKEVENMGSNEFVNSPEQNVQDDMSVTSTNNSIPQNEQNVKSDNTNINNSMQNSQENIQETKNNNTKGENINWNKIERPEDDRKIRKHYKSIIESDNTTAEAKSIAKDLMGTDTYVPETNKGQLAQADQRIMTSSPEAELQSLLSRSMNGEKISSVDIAVGERLIQYFSKTGSKQQLQEAIQATAMAGTSAGQTVQALSMLNHQTPQGQATWIQRSVDKMNKELAKKKGGTITTDADGNLQVINKQGKDITNKVDLFNLTPEMIDKIMNSENQEQMYKNIDEVYEELGQQVPKSMIEKIDTWRYFSMLANARTHIRNMVGNVAMGKMQRVKDKIAGGIEDVVSKFNPEMERTKTLRRADAKTKDFAKQDFKNMEVQSRLELNENKYNPQSRLQNARRTFKSNAMENTLGRLFNLNDKLLSAEDGIGLKAGYQKALADYITANKIDVDNITDAQLNKARNYAVQQAKEATFHQANAIASAVAQFENKNLATKLFTGAVLPFKKTPMNVAKAGMEYSPLQIAKSATVDLVNLRKGNISVNQYIDNLSKGMTGTGIALVGYALANAGILKASGGDDKDKEKYEEEQGKQSYSIQIAGKTYSLDWLAPTGIPLFIGAETFKLFNQENTEKSTEKSSGEDKLKQAIKGASNLLNAGATAINPMSEMSMISGLTSALSSYNTSDNLGSLGNIMTNAGKSYVNQFFPTLMGQVAKTTDKYERTTKSTATGTIGKAVDQTINQIKNKVPGLRQTLPIKTDIWGKEVKQEVNLPLRAVNNFINPATVKEVSTDKVDMELNKLYEENHSSSLLPDILTKTVQLNKQTYRLSNKEYAEFTKNYGQTSHKLIENFIKTSDYNKLTQEQKETAISNIYSYAKEQNKLDYAKKVNEEVKPSTLYTTMKEIEKGGGKQSEYLSYLAKTKGISKENEKNKVLADSNYSNKTKEIIYTNGTGKDDNLYNNLLSKSNIDMTEYLEYKNKLSEKAFGADKDKNGKTIAGSAKAKTINYLNNNITGVGNRLLIAGKSYALQNSEKQKLAEYINQIANTKEDRINIYKQLDKNFYVRNEKVYMRVSK